MSDYNNENESTLFSEQPENDEFHLLRTTLENVVAKSKETWSSLSNEDDIEVANSFFGVVPTDKVVFNEDDLHAKIKISEGMNAAAILSASKENVKALAKFMMGGALSDDVLEDIEMQQGALTECTNQYIGTLCTTLTALIDDVLQINAPDFFIGNQINPTEVMHEISRNDNQFIQAEFIITIASEVKIKFSLFLTELTANGLIFRIKNTESKNLLKRDPELSRSLAEYFTLLSSKYKTIFSMVGITGVLSVKEITSIHSLQCLDSSVINNYSVSNKISGQDIYNAYIFEKSFVDEIKAMSYDADTNSDSSWEILKELNNQFLHIFLTYCSDSKIVFDNVDCKNFLKLPDNQYLLVSFKVGDYSFYQMISFNLVEKLTFNLSKEDKMSVDYSKVNNLCLQQQGLIEDVDVTEQSNGNSSLLGAYKDIPMELSVLLGEKEFLLREVLRFSPGYVIHFDRRTTEDVDICINDIKKAKGEVGELPYNKSNNCAVRLKKIIKE